MTCRHAPHVVPRAILFVVLVGVGPAWGEPSITALNFIPRAVSADGSVVVGERADQAVRWTLGAATVALGTLPDDWYSEARWFWAIGGAIHAFRWTREAGEVALPVRFAEAISADGAVVLAGARAVCRISNWPESAICVTDRPSLLRTADPPASSVALNATLPPALTEGAGPKAA